MTVIVELPPGTEEKVRERASRLGIDVPAFIRSVIEREVQAPRTLDAILAPFQDEVAGSGISDDELVSLFEAERSAAHNEKRYR